jgi:Ca2+-binding RTX toxin-like protein
LLNDGTDFGTITEYVAADDSIIVQVDAGETVIVASQTVTATGLDVVFSNGAVVTFTGLTADIPESEFTFVEAGPTTPTPDPTGEVITDEPGRSISASLEPGPSLANMGDGDDTVIGSTGQDTINGGTGADVLGGGDGDDIISGTDVDLTTASDTDADVLDGGAGDDQLILGNGDSATGGAGADDFIVASDVTGNVIVSDFNPSEDEIIVQTETGTTFQSQAVVGGDLVITLTNASTITLTGVTVTINSTLIRFEDPTP